MAGDTIFALSSGAPPAAIAVIRISGPRAGPVLENVCGALPEPRRAGVGTVRDPDNGSILDRALILWFPGPNTATGEDLAELHLHGGRAVVRAVEAMLARQDGLRPAEPGEFTRRAFENGRIDLAEAEGLADLLSAETEYQRRAALQSAEGALSRRVAEWQEELLRLSARVEAELDFSDEDDVEAGLDSLTAEVGALAEAMRTMLAQPRAERLRDGLRVVLAGPPNAGKSSLFNRLAEREAAIVTDRPGTTRDLLEAAVAIDGVPILFVDTAGLREDGDDPVEAIGIGRASEAAAAADILLWLGPEGEGPAHEKLIEITPKSDLPDHAAKASPALAVSASTGKGIDRLVTAILSRARTMLPPPDQPTLNARQAGHVARAAAVLEEAREQVDFLIVAEHLRQARRAMDAITGSAGTEAMLDALFGRFCIGK